MVPITSWLVVIAGFTVYADLQYYYPSLKSGTCLIFLIQYLRLNYCLRRVQLTLPVLLFLREFTPCYQRPNLLSYLQIPSSEHTPGIKYVHTVSRCDLVPFEGHVFANW